MKKNRKYIAGLIIVLGLVFIYFIPQTFNKHGCDSVMQTLPIKPIQSTNITTNNLPILKFSDDKFQKIFDKAEVVILIDGLRLVEGKKMYGTIVNIVNKNKIPLRYKIGDDVFIDTLIIPDSMTQIGIPDSAAVFLYTGSNYIKNGDKLYFNNHKLSNGYTFDFVHTVFKNYGK